MANRRGQQQQITPLERNQERLRAYDAAVGSDARTQSLQDRGELAREKFDFEQQKTGFDQALKQSTLEQRASQFEQRNQRLQEASGVMKDLHEAQIAAMQAKQEAQAMLDQRRNDHTTEIATNAAGLLKGMAGLDREAADYPAKVAQLKAQFSPGLNNPEVAKSVQYDLEQHDKAQTAKFLADPARLNEAIAKGISVSGEVNASGTFIPGGRLDPNDSGKISTDPKKGEGVGNFVQTTVVGPNGKPEVILLPRTNYDPIIAAYQAKQAAPPPASTTTAAPNSATPTTPTDQVAPIATAPPIVPAAAPTGPPQAAIDYLKANPDAAPHFDAKYGQNASTEHLTE